MKREPMSQTGTDGDVKSGFSPLLSHLFVFVLITALRAATKKKRKKKKKKEKGKERKKKKTRRWHL